MKLFLGNLPRGWSAPDVQRLLVSNGLAYLYVSVPFKGGFGFAAFETDAEGEVARRELDGIELRDGRLNVNIAIQEETMGDRAMRMFQDWGRE